MHAGSLLVDANGRPSSNAAIASGLLALTALDRDRPPALARTAGPPPETQARARARSAAPRTPETQTRPPSGVPRPPVSFRQSRPARRSPPRPRCHPRSAPPVLPAPPAPARAPTPRRYSTWQRGLSDPRIAWHRRIKGSRYVDLHIVRGKPLGDDHRRWDQPLRSPGEYGRGSAASLAPPRVAASPATTRLDRHATRASRVTLRPQRPTAGDRSRVITPPRSRAASAVRLLCRSRRRVRCAPSLVPLPIRRAPASTSVCAHVQPARRGERG